MAEFAYNNAKNASTSHTYFKLNCRYYFCVSYKEDLIPCSKSKFVEELSSEIRELIIVCHQNFYHTQKLQKQAHKEVVKSQSYALGNKVWLSSKYLKTKKNRKLKTKFLGLFWILYSVIKQTYKLELPKKYKIYNVFYV